MTTPTTTAARPVLAAVNAEIRALGDLDDHQATTAAFARALAGKVDQAAASKTGAIALAVGSLVKELRAVMAELRSPLSEVNNNELVRSILADD
jgi:hypothetical protein